jgi:hypothetical protein
MSLEYNGTLPPGDIPPWDPVLGDMQLQGEVEEVAAMKESDLSSVSAALFLQAVALALREKKQDARSTALIAAYLADQALSLEENPRPKAPWFVATAATIAVDQKYIDHAAILKAGEIGAATAMERFHAASRELQGKVEDKWWAPPYYGAKIHAACYGIMLYSDIAQDQFQDTYPTVEERNWALWFMCDDVEEVVQHLDPLVHFVIVEFAKEVVDRYDSPDAERDQILEARSACYQSLRETTYRMRNRGGKNEPARKLADDIRTALHNVRAEQAQLGLRNYRWGGQIIDSWPKLSELAAQQPIAV